LWPVGKFWLRSREETVAPVKSKAVNAGIWMLFVAGTVIATAPVWRIYAFGVNPTLDEALQLSICGGRVDASSSD
jgi:hypothetical protein